MYEDRLYEALKEEMLQEITQTDKREGSFVNDIISTSAMKGEEVWAELSRAVGVFFRRTAPENIVTVLPKSTALPERMGRKQREPLHLREKQALIFR